MTFSEKLDFYAKKIELDTQVDATNLREKIESSANVKHQWLYKLIQEKRALIELNVEKEDYILDEFSKDVLNSSKAMIKAKAEKSKEVHDLNKKIKNQELIVEYLDMAVNKIFTQMGYDYKAIVDLIKMEQL